jgi:hypothetical protein
MLEGMEMSDFAKRLQQEIDARGIDRKELSRATDIPYHRIDPWFRRVKAKPRGDDLLVVARFLDVDQGYLLSGGTRQPFNPDAVVLRLHQMLDAKSRQELEDFALFLLQRQQHNAREESQQRDQHELPG